MPPALMAAVDGFTRLGGSQYVDSIHNGNYATYTVRDVVGHVDREYRTIAAEGGRAVLGKSSGGFGALHLTMEHPGVFGAFASHSGDAYFRYAHFPAFPSVQRTLEQHGGDVAAFVAAFEEASQAPDERLHDDGDARSTRRRTRRAAPRHSISTCRSTCAPERSTTRSSRAGCPTIRPSALPDGCARCGDYACVISTAGVATNIRLTSGRGSSRNACARPDSTFVTRSSTTITATWDIATKFRCRL